MLTNQWELQLEKNEYRKPLPFATADSRQFWEGAKRHELVLPVCNACEKPFYYPRLLCPGCGSRDIRWERMSGKGTVYTLAIQYRPQGPGFVDDVPYITALIDLDEGPRMLSNLVGVEPDPSNVPIGKRVEVVFEDVTPEVTLPKFKLVEE